MPQDILAPYWTLEPGWHSQLELRNSLLHESLTVQPVLRSASGEEFELSPVTLAADEAQTVDLREAAASVAPNLGDAPGSFGAVVLRYTSYNAANILAGVIVHQEGQPIEFHVDAAAAMPDFQVGTLESVWWLPRPTSDGYLMLSNSTPSPLQVTLAMSEASGLARSQALTLAPLETRRLGLREVVTSLGLRGEAGGLTLTAAGNAGALGAAEVLFDETTGFSAMMRVFARDPNDMTHARTLRAPTVALAHPDPVLGFPTSTTLRPSLLLRNTTIAPLVPAIQLSWRSAAATGVAAIRAAALRPGEMRRVNLAPFEKTAGLPDDAMWAVVSIAYNGRSGDLVAESASFDATGRYGVQSPFSEGAAAKWRGSIWQVDSTHDTLLTVGSAS